MLAFILTIAATLGFAGKLVLGQANNASPVENCRLLKGDSAWPTPQQWTRAMPHVVGQASSTYPDYRLDAESINDVIAAVNFTREHNIRLTILNSGHDFHGRNNAPTGLALVVANIQGVRVLPDFTATVQGARPVDPHAATNVLNAGGKQAYVTFGVGMTTQALNDQLAPSKLFTLGAAHGGVGVAGGYSQTAGHTPLGPKYGIGADQVVEFKVVTADGVLRVANEVSNPELFWALRGGGGGTFGVVVEATVKAFPSPRVATSVTFINTTNPTDYDSIWPAMAWLHAQLPQWQDRGLSAYYYIFPNGLEFFAMMSGEEGSSKWMDQNWKPVMQRLTTFPGMSSSSFIFVSSSYPDHKSFFDSVWGDMEHMDKRDARDRELLQFFKRHGPEEMEEVESQGISKMDSWLLGAEHLTSPKFGNVLKAGLPKGPNGQMRGQLVGGGKVVRSTVDNAVNPAWRKTYLHMILKSFGETWADAGPFREFAPEMGAYANEVNPHQPGWKQKFWGANYHRLSEIKKKYDPEHHFWVTPGIDADFWEVKDGRLCRSQPQASALLEPPASDNHHMADASRDDDWKPAPFPYQPWTNLLGLPLI